MLNAGSAIGKMLVAATSMLASIFRRHSRVKYLVVRCVLQALNAFRCALIRSTKTRTRDAVAEMAAKRIAASRKRAEDELVKRRPEQQQRVDHLLNRFGEVRKSWPRNLTTGERAS
jgi:hypothetical protein